MFVVGWFVGWLVLLIAIVAVEALRARRVAVRRELEAEHMARREQAAIEAEAAAKRRIEEVERDPVGAALLKGLRDNAERIIRQEGVTISWPPGAPPDMFVGFITSLARSVDAHLEMSKAMHDQLKSLDGEG